MTRLTKFPEPPSDISDPSGLFVQYLRFYRGELVRRIESLDAQTLGVSTVPSGWTPLQMLSHLVYMEQRWFVWGFLGESVEAPWGDWKDGAWHVPDGVDSATLLGWLAEGASKTEAVLAAHSLDEVAAPGGRFSDELPTLSWICFHVLQEYARHLGHLDVAVELAGGPTGEGS